MLGGADNPNGELLSYIIGADNCTKRSFRSIIIRLRQTVITVITEGIPLIQYIAERFAQSGFFRQRTILLHHPFMQRRQ